MSHASRNPRRSPRPGTGPTADAPAGTSRVAVPLLAALLLLAVALPASGGVEHDPAETVRGVIVSTHTDGSDWASAGMRSTLADIGTLGADWVAIHPYARIQADGTVRFRPLDPGNPPAELARPIAEAHALGLKILIKPHLAYWGSPFSWRGDIRFRTEAEWNRFFTTYTAWIDGLVEACPGADGFVVATELDATLDHEAAWRRVIASVRARTHAPLTYGANWTHYRDVPFWDALDVIGIQAYFPLTDAPRPDSATVAAGWSRLMDGLHDYALAQNRRIVFTELGYNRAFDAPLRPWDYAVDGADAEAMQALCLGAALRAVDAEPMVVGVFLWKWFPNPYPVGRNFQLATPGLKRVIAAAWSE